LLLVLLGIVDCRGVNMLLVLRPPLLLLALLVLDVTTTALLGERGCDCSARVGPPWKLLDRSGDATIDVLFRVSGAFV